MSKRIGEASQFFSGQDEDEKPGALQATTEKVRAVCIMFSLYKCFVVCNFLYAEKTIFTKVSLHFITYIASWQ